MDYAVQNLPDRDTPLTDAEWRLLHARFVVHATRELLEEHLLALAGASCEDMRAVLREYVRELRAALRRASAAYDDAFMQRVDEMIECSCMRHACKKDAQ